MDGPIVFEFKNYSKSLPPNNVVIFDRDDTLILDVPNLSNPEEIVWIPGALSLLKELKQNQIQTFVASNQRAISKGKLTQDNLFRVSEKIFQDSKNAGGELSTFVYCPHGFETIDDTSIRYNCRCRKPLPGMIDYIISAYGLSGSRIIFIGDKESDRVAAQSASQKVQFIGVKSNIHSLPNFELVKSLFEKED
jgi:D-glycero-D-manno-heptose 1,7-bisphosphate phosphatase